MDATYLVTSHHRPHNYWVPCCTV